MKKFLYYLAFAAESLRFITPRHFVDVPYEEKRRFCKKYQPILSKKRAKRQIHNRTMHK